MCCQDQLYQTCALTVGNRFTFVSAFLLQGSRLFMAARLYFAIALALSIEESNYDDGGWRGGWGLIHVPAGCVMVSYYSHS